MVFHRGGNRASRVGFGFGFGFGSDGSGQFNFLEEIGSGQFRVGSRSGRTGSGRVNLYFVFFQIVDRFRLD
jgi:FAD synthase